MRLVHTNRHGLELSRRLLEPSPTPLLDSYEPLDVDVESKREVPKQVYLDRKLSPNTVEKVSPSPPAQLSLISPLRETTWKIPKDII